MTLDEWDDDEHVDPLVRYYHELCEYVILSKDGVLPLIDDEREDADDTSQAARVQRGPDKTIRTRPDSK